MSDDLFNIDDLLNSALKKEGLNDLFEKKLDELKLNKTNVQEILGMPYRTLKGILDGTQKLVDVNNLVKLADFLKISKEEVFKLYVDSVQKYHPVSNVSTQKIKFIKENFDLIALKKAGLINNMTDFEHIDKKITARLGFRSIYEYKKPEVDIAFSSGLFKPKNLLTRLFWIKSAICILEEINNPYEYDRPGLIKFFPHIAWYSMNVERGLAEIIRALFKLGITVVYQPNLQGLQLRGATLKVNDKPCIVLTNYQGFYSTLWHCLIHELYHVFFDWEDIKKDSYHLTDDDNQELTVQEREREADKFARDYLLTEEKLNIIKPYLNDEAYVKRFAEENHVHFSIIYAYHAFSNSNDRKSWARLRRLSPPVADAIKNLDYPWQDEKPLEEHVVEQKELTYKM